MNEREDIKTKTTKKFPIVCKFWMMNSCSKNDKCAYLHEQIVDKRPVQSEVECPWYGFGFCKNGPNCQFKHTKAEASNTPETLPPWYLEYIYGKPIKNIFDDFEKIYPDEVNLVRNRLQITEYKHYKNTDNYALKKNRIIENLNRKVRYFFIRCKGMDLIKHIMEMNILPVNKMNMVKFKEAKKSCDDVIFIIFDNESKNFYGYCKFKFDLEEKGYDTTTIDLRQLGIGNSSYVKVEWLWKTKLSESKIELLRNPLSDGELVINSTDGQEIAIDIGYYMCRLMIKRLTKEEVQEYISEKKQSDRSNLSSTKMSDINATTEIININNVKMGGNGNDTGRTISAIKDNINNLLYDELHKNKPNSIIVTNISNLQVNISQNSYCENKLDLGDLYNNNTRKKTSNKRRRRRSSTDEYDSDETVKQESKLLSQKRQRESESPKANEKKIYKNKLFSNAMEKLLKDKKEDKSINNKIK
jgi:hypothetical protein